MFKKLFPAIFPFFLATITFSQSTLTISGKLLDAKGGSLFLKHDNEMGYLNKRGEAYLTEDGSFVFDELEESGGMYILEYKDAQIGYILPHDAKHIKWSATYSHDFKNILKTTAIEGSENSSHMLYLMRTLSGFLERRDTIKRKYEKTANPDSKKKMDAEMNAIGEEVKVFLRKEIKAKPNSVALISFVDNLDTFDDSEYLKLLADGTYRKYPDDRRVKKFHYRIAKNVRTGVGTYAPDIELNSFRGGNVKLSSLQGKVVLLDFWGISLRPTWPAASLFTGVHNKYAARGFEIYAVSISGSPERLMDDNPAKAYLRVGVHVNDPDTWNSQVLRTYGVDAVRSNVLIDKDGRILAKDLTPDDLEKWLEKLLP